jgi:hypothetical protein
MHWRYTARTPISKRPILLPDLPARSLQRYLRTRFARRQGLSVGPDEVDRLMLLLSGVPTARGGRWQGMTVSNVLARGVTVACASSRPSRRTRIVTRPGALRTVSPAPIPPSLIGNGRDAIFMDRDVVEVAQAILHGRWSEFSVGPLIVSSGWRE